MDTFSSQVRPAKEVIESLKYDPIPASPYYDDRYFKEEIEAVFKNCWLQIAHECELPEPGSFVVKEIEVASASILITRDKSGSINAFHNVCTHRGTELVSSACGKQASFSCPYHRWTFNGEGRLLAAPDFERFYVDKSALDLVRVSVDVCAGMIFVNLNPEPEQSLAEFLGPMGEMIKSLPVASATTYDEYVYEIDANWKVTFDNFQENYHLRFVHARTNGAPPLDSTDNPFNYPVNYEFFGPHRMNTSPGGVPPDMDTKPVQKFMMTKMAEQLAKESLMDAAHARDYFIFFPNLYVFGSPRMHFTHLVMPLSSGRARGVFRFYWPNMPKNNRERFIREFTLAFSREIHTEDSDALRKAQRGLNSGALKHMHFQQHEVLCRHLYHAVDQRVQAYRNATQRDA